MHSRRSLARHKRLALIIERLNRVHCFRRITGRPTAHLYPRSKAVTAAYLDAISPSPTTTHP